ncbi:MAG TPA: VOC family protein [Albidovulum sp.]|uniref:VOC family protein n=1 Tax=Albidovulum sp. TaxID=1872424 RepID=UPI002B7E7E9E|nr:VOC family protein [Albidovulum sp.]
MATFRMIVRDVGASAAFYVTHFGFTLREQFGPAMAILDGDGLTLWLAGPLASASRPMPDGDVPEPGGWNRPVFLIADLDQRVATLKAAGVGFRNEIVSGPGGRQVLCLDPSGNVIELFEPA